VTSSVYSLTVKGPRGCLPTVRAPTASPEVRLLHGCAYGVLWCAGALALALLRPCRRTHRCWRRLRRRCPRHHCHRRRCRRRLRPPTPDPTTSTLSTSLTTLHYSPPPTSTQLQPLLLSWALPDSLTWLLLAYCVDGPQERRQRQEQNWSHCNSPAKPEPASNPSLTSSPALALTRHAPSRSLLPQHPLRCPAVAGTAQTR
jgi:hypothetical protein